MIEKDGVRYPTVADAATHFGVSTRTVLDWVQKGKIPEPPFFEFGARDVYYFPSDYLTTADKALEKLRVDRRNKKRKQGKNRT